MNGTYRHAQGSPLCLIIYTAAIIFCASGLLLRDEPVVSRVFSSVGALLLLLAASFHHLHIEDAGDRLSICFGPIRLFRRSIRYEDIASVETGRTSILDGWGIHMSFRGGWVWNIRGRDCVVVQHREGILRLGTDDSENLVAFLQSRLPSDNPD